VSACKTKECKLKHKLSLQMMLLLLLLCCCDIYTAMVAVYVAVLQESLALFPWLMNIGNFPLYCLHQECPDKMDSIMRRRLSLTIFLWSYVRMSCHMWTTLCRECDRQCLYHVELNLILKNLFGVMTSNIFTQTFKITCCVR
jgi:hypothetical protein